MARVTGTVQALDAVETIARFIAREVSPSQAGELWTATYWLAGLRYNPEVSAPLFQGVRAVRASATYQAAVAEGRAEGEARGEARGRAEEARRLLLLVAGQRFGPPSARARRTLAALSNVERLERITARLLQASDWDDLLGTP